jgi:hypothetical protein
LDRPLFNLGSISGGTIAQVRHANVFQIERTTEADRLRITVEEAPLSLLWKLARPLAEPSFVLYILHTSRGGSQLGRYQSPAVQFDAVNGFMAEFCEFLTDDGRHDLWLHSPRIWTFGTVSRSGRPPPDPHAHMYHAQYDEAERRILRYFQCPAVPCVQTATPS